jgi:ATP-dependent RNA circularization protein (DNA/RNA ligase family)
MENKYIHVENLKSTEVQNILNGECHIYPKLDGANASICLGDSGEIVARSRNNVLTPENNLRGFYGYVQGLSSTLEEFFLQYEDIVIFGEWLVPHTLKTYKSEAWHEFYAFDFYDKKSERFLNFEALRDTHSKFGFELVPCLAKLENPPETKLEEVLNSNTYLLESGVGEGIVIKNFDFVNKYGRQAYAKLTTKHFQAKHDSSFKSNAPKDGEDLFEKKLVYKYLSDEYVLKELNKFENFESAKVSELISIVYEEFIRDYISEIISKYKNPSINFKTLRKHLASYVVDTVLR